MSKKHIRIGCALLALVLVLTAGIVVLNTEAAEVLTMPKEKFEQKFQCIEK